MSRMSELIYPDAPGFKAGPSEDAARTVITVASKLRPIVLTAIAQSPGGATADEIAEQLNLSVLSVRRRVSELNRNGLIVQTGARRRNASGMTATVWRVASQLPSGVASQSAQPIEPETLA
jgi:predicted ArsR family transcriptional regulator